MVSPVRVRPGSLTEAAAEKLVRLPGEREELTASGDMLMKAGAWLKQGFSGTGFDGETRVMGDFGSRLYVLEAPGETMFTRDPKAASSVPTGLTDRR